VRGLRSRCSHPIFPQPGRLVASHLHSLQSTAGNETPARCCIRLSHGAPVCDSSSCRMRAENTPFGPTSPLDGNLLWQRSRASSTSTCGKRATWRGSSLTGRTEIGTQKLYAWRRLLRATVLGRLPLGSVEKNTTRSFGQSLHSCCSNRTSPFSML
jgi:hypothetical protein